MKIFTSLTSIFQIGFGTTNGPGYYLNGVLVWIFPNLPAQLGFAIFMTNLFLMYFSLYGFVSQFIFRYFTLMKMNLYVFNFIWIYKLILPVKALSLDVPESICSTTFIMPVPTYLFPFPDFLNSQSNQKGTYFEALFHDRLP